MAGKTKTNKARNDDNLVDEILNGTEKMEQPEKVDDQLKADTESPDEKPEKPKEKKKELRVKNNFLATRTIHGSVRRGDDDVPFDVKMDEEGVSEVIKDEDIYQKLLATGCEPV